LSMSFIELIGVHDEPIIISCMSYSHSVTSQSAYSSRYSKPKKVLAEGEIHPTKWNDKQVADWLKDQGLEDVSVLFLKNGVKGSDLLLIRSKDVLKELGVDLMPRIRTEFAIEELFTKYQVESPNEEEDIQFDSLSLMCHLDDRSMQGVHMLCNGITIPEAVLTVYKGPNRRGGREIEDPDTPAKAQLYDPLFRIVLKKAKVGNISLSGSDRSPTMSMSISASSISYIVQQYPADAMGRYANAFPLPFGVELNYENNKATIREWGKITSWNFKTHFAYPQEFKDIVTTMLNIFTRFGEEGNYIAALPKTALLHIFYFLSFYYIPVSPFANANFPGKRQDPDNPNLGYDDDYF